MNSHHLLSVYEVLRLHEELERKPTSNQRLEDEHKRERKIHKNTRDINPWNEWIGQQKQYSCSGFQPLIRFQSNGRGGSSNKEEIVRLQQ